MAKRGGARINWQETHSENERGKSFNRKSISVVDKKKLDTKSSYSG